MKILNIYFKNINSLEGESQIHFDQAPLVDGGVFAITGPNGSGKSSILDVITLGLYGETYRFDRPTNHVMTKSTAESFAQVEFSLGADMFRSSWQVKRENDDSKGALLSSDMKLMQLNGAEQVIEQGTQKVRNRMIELTGMDFHKFSKSMVLAQGDFSAFLNSLDSERMDILEKISGTDIYDDYKKQAEEKNTRAQLRLQQLQQDLDAIPVLDDIRQEALEQDLEDFNEQCSELEKEYEDVQQQLLWLHKTINLGNQLDSLVNQQQLVNAQLAENQKKLDQIAASQDMIPFEEELMRVDNKAEVVQRSKKTLDSYRSELELLQKQLQPSIYDENSHVTTHTVTEQKSSIDKFKFELSEFKVHLPQEKALVESFRQQIEEKKSVLTVTENWLQERVADKSLLENFPDIETLTNFKARLVDLTEKQKTYVNWSKNTTEGLQKKRTEISGLNKKNSDLKVQIETDEKMLEVISEGHSLQDLLEIQSEQQLRVNDFLELNSLALVNSKLEKKGFINQWLVGDSDYKAKIQLQQEASQLQMVIGREQVLAKTLEQAVFNEMLLQKMQEDRVHLIDRRPCPLCGALEHPYAKYAPAVSHSKQLLADQQVKVTKLMVESKNLVNQIATAQKQAEKDDYKEGQLQVIYSQWKTLANRLNVASIDMDIDKLSEIKDLLKAEKAELSNLTKLIKQYTKLQDSISLSKSSIESNKTILIRLNKEAEELNVESHSRPDESNELEQAYAQCQSAEHALSKKVLEQLSSLGEKMPTNKAKENALITRLGDRREEYQTRMLHQKALVEEVKELEQKVVTSLTKIDEMSHGIEQSIERVQQEEIVGLHLSLTEKQKLIAEKELVLSQQETELVSVKQNLLDKINVTEEADLKGLRETIALVKLRPDIQQKRLELTQSVRKIQNNLEHVQEQLEILQAEDITEKTEEELLTLKKSNEVKLDIAMQEVASLENKLKNQNDLQEKCEQIMAKVTRQKAEVNASTAEIKLITDNNGVHFRRKVQHMMADQLLSQSNQILEKISSRYYVRKGESEHGLALEIEDTKQKNVRRLPKTLSGGECFIVSLALALGLAEMAHNGHAVDSLFLDEGFGNLDAESLYLVMTTLESLKTHGKVVGVISHVEGVRKRIKTQIEMIKKPNGLSALKIAS